MSWSEAEILALAVKAARGAGAPPGQAVRFGQAAVVHLTAGRAPADLEAALDALPGGPVMTLPLAVDKALAGEEHLRWPPKLCEDLAASYVEALPFRVSLVVGDSGRTRLQPQPEVPREQRVPARIVGCDPLVARMTALAESTYVPESADSRRSGAGAGLDDND